VREKHRRRLSVGRGPSECRQAESGRAGARLLSPGVVGLGVVGLGVVGLGVIMGRARAARRRGRRRPPGARTEDVEIRGQGRAERTAELARLGSRVGRIQLSGRAERIFAGAERRREIDRRVELRTAEEVARTLGEMKGVMMKLGQMASYVDEGLPEAYRASLSVLQTNAPPMSADLARQVVREELGAEPSELFARFDPVPIASASIGQVHRAITTDGRAVAVKIQYPGVAEAMAADLDNTDLMARALTLLFPSLDPASLVGEVRARLAEELDYRHEAAQQRLFADFYRGHPFITIPDVVEELSSRRVLTTDLAEGVRLDEVADWPERDRQLAAECIFRFVFRSLYRLHAFNGDPHPGNYLFRPDGQVTFLDFGLVRRFDPDEVRVFEEMARTLILEPDEEAFRRIMERVDLLRPGAPLATADVVEFFRHFYDLVLEDREVAVTPEFASGMMRRLFDASDPVTRFTNVPPMFVVVQRINLGLYAILAKLRARANWRRITEELWPMVDAPPSTELGRREAAWWAAKAARPTTPTRGGSPAPPAIHASGDLPSDASESSPAPAAPETD
jgi:predicted unusual protein kinase regulating ubiquinone biosynthesis (AarF/ABC1/UbiB family)